MDFFFSMPKSNKMGFPLKMIIQTEMPNLFITILMVEWSRPYKTGHKHSQKNIIKVFFPLLTWKRKFLCERHNSNSQANYLFSMKFVGGERKSGQNQQNQNSRNAFHRNKLIHNEMHWQVHSIFVFDSQIPFFSRKFTLIVLFLRAGKNFYIKLLRKQTKQWMGIFGSHIRWENDERKWTTKWGGEI